VAPEAPGLDKRVEGEGVGETAGETGGVAYTAGKLVAEAAACIPCHCDPVAVGKGCSDVGSPYPYFSIGIEIEGVATLILIGMPAWGMRIDVDTGPGCNSGSGFGYRYRYGCVFDHAADSCISSRGGCSEMDSDFCCCCNPDPDSETVTSAGVCEPGY